MKIFDDLAILYARRGKPDEALTWSRKATAALTRNLVDAAPETSNALAGTNSEQTRQFLHHVANLAAVEDNGILTAENPGNEAFEIAQWADQSTAGAAIQQMALRFAPGNSALGSLVRDKQDLSAFWRNRNAELVKEISKPDNQRNASLIKSIRNQIAESESKIADVTGRLEKGFPNYAALSSPKPLSVENVQQLLSADEALIFLLPGDDQSYVFAVSKEEFAWRKIALNEETLTQKVAAFRRRLDPEEFTRSLSSGEPVLFDLSLANELYTSLLGGVEPLIKGKRSLLVVPSGPLTALPFHLLATEKPTIAVSSKEDLTPYRDAAWLLKRSAITVLPSVAGLKSLRDLSRDAKPTKALVGFGDPVF